MLILTLFSYALQLKVCLLLLPASTRFPSLLPFCALLCRVWRTRCCRINTGQSQAVSPKRRTMLANKIAAWGGMCPVHSHLHTENHWCWRAIDRRTGKESREGDRGRYIRRQTDLNGGCLTRRHGRVFLTSSTQSRSPTGPPQPRACRQQKEPGRVRKGSMEGRQNGRKRRRGRQRRKKERGGKRSWRRGRIRTLDRFLVTESQRWTTGPGGTPASTK